MKTLPPLEELATKIARIFGFSQITFDIILDFIRWFNVFQETDKSGYWKVTKEDIMSKSPKSTTTTTTRNVFRLPSILELQDVSAVVHHISNSAAGEVSFFTGALITGRLITGFFIIILGDSTIFGASTGLGAGVGCGSQKPPMARLILLSKTFISYAIRNIVLYINTRLQNVPPFWLFPQGTWLTGGSVDACASSRAWVTDAAAAACFRAST